MLLIKLEGRNAWNSQAEHTHIHSYLCHSWSNSWSGQKLLGKSVFPTKAGSNSFGLTCIGKEIPWLLLSSACCLNSLWGQLALHTLDRLSWPPWGCGYVVVDLCIQTSLLLSPKLHQSWPVLINSSFFTLSSYKICLYLPGKTFSDNKTCNGR